MPRVYRSMKKDADGRPCVEPSAVGLGVRTTGAKVDVDVDASGDVLANSKGMSVAPRWRDLPFFRIPRRLKDRFRDASGANEPACFAHGEGDFAYGPIAGGLELNPDSATHGVIAPLQSMPLDDYEKLLEDTRDGWFIDEA